MNILKLDNEHAFSIENLDKQVRLVVYNNGVENVCRKSTLKNIGRFIQSGDNHLFKGRLQLNKMTDGIGVVVKDSLVGKITMEDFMNCLENAKNGI
ncbi:MAG: hypothetical protein JWR09_2672 [Mucilaginibacter sp.]|nr:hypothetical protein [Mucilaginibacter sp.]